MHITKVDLKNVKSLGSFTWALDRSETTAGWHVLIGDNGTGKSAFLRACAVALLGPRNALGLRQPWSDWIRQGESEARINLTVNQAYASDQWSGKGMTKTGQLRFGVVLADSSIESTESKTPAIRHVWGTGSGWFSASFGPYRRFSGGNPEYEKLFYSTPKLASHLSIFGEDVALSETLTWLRNLHYEDLDREKRLGVSIPPSFLGRLKAFINQDGFLPNGAKLSDIGPKAVTFLDPNGIPIDIVALSDGFRSILSMTLELIRQLSLTYGQDKVFSADAKVVDANGVVLIDEVDVHLHPRWQRSIGPWLTQHFPNIQFIVTTHSALVCQGAIRGSITRLPNASLSDPGGRLSGAPLDRLLYGDILEALSSGAFGQGIDRSPEGQSMLEELAALNSRARKSALTPDDETRRRKLQTVFGIESSMS